MVKVPQIDLIGQTFAHNGTALFHPAVIVNICLFVGTSLLLQMVVLQQKNLQEHCKRWHTAMCRDQ